MADAVVSFFAQALGRLLTQELKLLSGVHDDLAWIKAEHVSMEACLINADGRRHRDKDVEAWVGQVRHLVFAAEDAIDSFMIEREMQRHLRDESVMHFVAFHVSFIKRLMVRRKFRDQIQKIRRDVKEVYDRRVRYNLQDSKEPRSSSTPDGRHGDPGVAAPFIEEEDIVGTDETVEKLLSAIEVNTEHRIVISIVGMGGLGKTTLAKKVYYKSKEEKFEKVIKSRAWISVSQSFQIKDLLEQMLKELDKGREVVKMSESELRENIFNHLKGKGYLLVLDDIWEIDAWEGVKHALPREGRGIIIFTTRNEHVACPAEESWLKLDLMPLHSELAWDLFCRKAFRNNYPPGSCPPYLVDVAKAMVERCKGLPLAIVAIGGLMSKRSTLPSEWNDVLQNLDWELNHNRGLARLNQVLLASYYYLPSHLKYCFLYCGLFPEDYSIKRKKLIRLWIAEGFIKEYPRKTLEEVAGEYVVQLIQRSMLQPVVDPGTLQLKACKMHDLVRDMAIYLFKEEDFGAVLTNQNETVTARRLAIQKNEMTTPNTGELNPRSLLMFIEQEFTATSFRPSLVNLRLLRVLDLESCKIESLPDEVGGLIHLRYLSLKRSTVRILPPSLGRLCNLQTLDIGGTFVESLPDGATLLRLRHLLLNTNPIDLGSIKMSNLEQLQTLMYCVRPAEMLVEQLGKLTQLRKLCVIRVNSAYWTQLCASISKMQHLRSLSLGADSDEEALQLETFSPPHYIEQLKLHGRMKKLPQWLGSVDCLCELILFGTHLEEDPFGVLKQLPNLAKVKLMNDAYSGKRLSLGPEGLPKLVYLGFVGMREFELEIFGPRRMQQLDFVYCEKAETWIYEWVEIVSVRSSGRKNCEISNLKTGAHGPIGVPVGCI